MCRPVRTLKYALRSDVVWGEYRELTVKLARSKRKGGCRIKVRPSTKVPTNWEAFICVGGNIDELVQLIAEGIQKHNEQDKLMVSTVGEGVASNSAEMEYHHLAPCTQEEADSRILLHVADMARTGKKKVRVRTVDSDVVVICIAWFHKIPGLEELWVEFGRGKQYRYIPVHQIAKSLGADKSKALLGFHAFTGCDSVSAFYDIGKKGPWQVWKDFPQVTEAFLFLSSTPTNILEHIMALIEEFVVRVYSSKLEGVTTVNRARYELFTYAGQDFDHLPPTKNALDFHTLRAAYIAGHIWGQALVPAPTLPKAFIIINRFDTAFDIAVGL